MDLEKKVLDRIAEQFKADRASLTPDTTLASLNADSLDMVELAMELEEEFSMAVEQTDITSIKTLGDIVKLVESRKK